MKRRAIPPSSDDSPPPVLAQLPIPPPVNNITKASRGSPSPRKKRVVTPPPKPKPLVIDVLEPETPPREIVPASSPVIPIPAPALSRTVTRQDAIDEFDDIPVEVLFSSPPQPSPTRNVRSQACPAPVMASSEAGPSSAVSTVRQPRPVQLDRVYPWSKEVADKLRTYFKIAGFRQNQREAIDETMAGKDGKPGVALRLAIRS